MSCNLKQVLSYQAQLINTSKAYEKAPSRAFFLYLFYESG